MKMLLSRAEVVWEFWDLYNLSISVFRSRACESRFAVSSVDDVIECYDLVVGTVDDRLHAAVAMYCLSVH